jgi:hypothetical protein
MMMYQGYQAVPPVAQQAFRAEVSQLAASYGLGQPQAQYSRATTGCLVIALASSIGLLTLGAAVLFVLSAQLPVSPFSSFPVPVVFIVPLLAIVGFLLWGFLLLRDRAYECTEGFIVVRGKRVVRAIRWDQIQRVWKERRYTRTSGGGSSVVIIYYIRDVQGQTHSEAYRPIWKRANYEHARREFAQMAPQMLADFNTGRYLLFGQLSVDQHGVSIPGSMTYRSQSYQLPLPAIVKASLGQRLVFEIASAAGVQSVSATIPENATRLLLLLQTLSQGRIVCEYDDWLIR